MQPFCFANLFLKNSVLLRWALDEVTFFLQYLLALLCPPSKGFGRKNYLLLLIPQCVKYLNYRVFHISARPPRRAALPFFGGDYFILAP